MQQHPITVEEFMDFFDEETIGMSDVEREKVLMRFLEGMEEGEGLTSRAPRKTRRARAPVS
jgi:hypothetical protein